MALTKKIFHIFTYLLVILIVCRESIGTPQRLCGRALPEALDHICVRGFNSKIKKSIDMDDYSYNDIDDELPYPYANSPFLAKIYGGAAELMAKTRRRRHGVYDECCRKGCTVAELVSYCL